MSAYKVPELGSYLFQPSVKDRDLTAPPGGEAKGDRYLIASVASGAWASKEKYIATYNGSGWDFTAPLEGMVIYVEDEFCIYQYRQSAWIAGTGNLNGENILYIGDSLNNDKQIIAMMGSGARPAIRYLTSGSQWQYSNDGTNWRDLPGFVSGTFTNGNLSSGVFTITHNLVLSAPYVIHVVIFDNNNQVIIPDNITGATNSVAIDLTSFGTITGTWGYSYGLISGAVVTSPIPLSYLDTDGTLAANSDVKVASQKAVKTFALGPNDGTVNPTNLLSNGDFENWSAGTAVAPDGWTMMGDGSKAVARESGIIKLGTYSVKVTMSSGTEAYIRHDATSVKGINYWKGRKITIGCWAYATVANRVRIRLTDGVVAIYTPYHTGGSTWEWLSNTLIVDSSPTIILIDLLIDTGNTTAYFDGAMCVEGESIFAYADKPAGGYLTGTFTPGISFNNGVTGITYSHQIGFYTKVGDIVFITGDVLLSNKGSDTGAARITGLPFTSIATYYQVISMYYSGVTFVGQFETLVEPNAKVLQLNKVSEAGVDANLTNSDFTNTSTIRFTGIYKCI